MDQNASVLQVGSSISAFHGFRLLRKVVIDTPTSPTEEQLQTWWKNISTQEYAFDDFSRGRLDWFLFMLGNPMSEFFEIGDHGMFMADLPQRPEGMLGGQASIHFVVWDRNFSLHQQREYAYELLDYLFYSIRVHRVLGQIPSYNRLAQRFATSMGMKFEGEMREAVLYKQQYHHVSTYGLLEREYRERRERGVK